MTPPTLNPVQLAKLVHYNPLTGTLTWRRRVHSRAAQGDECGHVNSHGYRCLRIEGRRYLSHRVAWCITHGMWPDALIDHINGNPLDNRLENLRCADDSENVWNSKRSKANLSGVKGVGWNRKAGQWLARVTKRRRLVFWGYFSDLNEAKAAVEAARKQAHGEHSRHA